MLWRAPRSTLFPYTTLFRSDTGGALAAFHSLVLGGHALEVLPAERELAVAIGVHHEAHHVGYRQTLGTLPGTRAAHAAEVGSNFFQAGGEDLLVGVGERLRHDGEVLLQLVDVGHAGDGSGDDGV